MTKVFISQPINNRDEEDILTERQEILRTLSKQFDDVYLLPTFFDFDNVIANNIPLYYLSRSLEYLSDADIAVFAKGWETKRGCIIEHECCIKYFIPIIYYDDIREE